MPKSPEAKRTTARRASPKRGKRKPTRSVIWTRVPALLAHVPTLLWKLLPVLCLVLFGLVAFVLDPAAVVRLAWACVSGVFGGSVQLAVAVVLLSITAATVWAFWPEPTPPPVPARPARPRKARPQPAPPAAPTTIVPAEPARPRRRSRIVTPVEPIEQQ